MSPTAGQQERSAVIISWVTEDPNKRPWLDDQAREFERALGQSVIAWYGVEMAIRDTGACPQFGDDEVDCIQLVHLAATMATGGVMLFTTYQDDENFGLRIDMSDPISRDLREQRRIA